MTWFTPRTDEERRLVRRYLDSLDPVSRSIQEQVIHDQTETAPLRWPPRPAPGPLTTRVLRLGPVMRTVPLEQRPVVSPALSLGLALNQGQDPE